MVRALERTAADAFVDVADRLGPGVPPLPERLHAFRSLGGNCEFGFVQRYCGAEPSGLLRFSYTPVDDLIHALDTDFAEFGTPGDLSAEPIDGTYYYCRSRRYNIRSNTSQRIDAIAPETLLEREYGRIAHLKQRMLAELASGSKILVRKVGQGETVADLDRLARAIRRHGPSTLLRVTEDGPDWHRRPVQRLSDRVLEGGVRRFAPKENAWDLDLEPWLALCDRAYAAWSGISESALDAGPFAQALPLPADRRRHRGRHRATKLSTFATPLDPTAFDPDQIYAFSAWVWIPEDFSGTRIFAIAGRDRLGYGDADIDRRACWQRIWVSGRVQREQANPTLGLGMVGTWRDRFWSCGAQMHTGPVPRPAEPPLVGIEPSLFGRLIARRG